MSAICGMVSFDGARVDPLVVSRMAQAVAGGAAVTVTLSSEGTAGFASSGAAAVARGSGAGATPRLCALLAADARLDNRTTLAASLPQTASAPSDADCLLACREQLGEAWHRRLRGAFAVAAWSASPPELRLLRDPCGERGLYWSRVPGGLLFASEPAQLLASGAVAGEPNRRRLLAYLIGAAAEPTWSYFEDVQRVPKGCQVRVTAGRVDLDRYWDWTMVPGDAIGARDAAPELARRLEVAVERRLPRNGGTGVLLSGGLDSASVAAVAADALADRGAPLAAFTWTSPSGDGIDETALSRPLIASRANVVERPVEADGLWPLSRYPDAYADRSDPETNAYPDLLLTTLEAACRQGVTVLMNGIGGDPVAGWLAPELGLLLRGRIDVLRQRWRHSGLRRAELLRELRAPTRRLSCPWLTPAARRAAREAGLERPPVSWRTFASNDRFRRTALAGLGNSDVLERFDRWSRRLGVRIEAPWHDLDIACWALGVPDRSLADLPPAKRWVREAMAGRLPAAILKAAGEKTDTRSALRERGLLGGAGERVTRLLGGSRLAELGLIDAKKLLATYRPDLTSGTVPSRLWEILTAECFLSVVQSSQPSQGVSR